MVIADFEYLVPQQHPTEYLVVIELHDGFRVGGKCEVCCV